jgi:type IV pilus assembly protein PilP
MRCIFFLIVLLNFSLSVKAQLEEALPSSAILDLLKLRDPFKPPKRAINEKKSGDSLLREGVYTNIGSADTLPLDSIRISGVILGERNRAIIGNEDNKSLTFMLSEGSKINNGLVELKAILPNGVIFVEKVVNVYGQTEYIETVVPISK